jgi:hypothetical protein
MSYSIVLTNGTALLTLADGARDTSTTSIDLIGRNYAGYGISVNENFIKLLENFASQNAPSNPLIGQLWWDSTNKHLSVWQGTNWKIISSSQTGATAPLAPVTGDFWWNTTTSQFSVYSGSSWVSIGPYLSPGAAVTALAANNVSDGSTLHYVGNVTVNNKLSGVFSTDNTSFTPVTAISGMTTIVPGLNLGTGLQVAGNALIGNISTGTIAAGIVTTSNAITAAGNVSAANFITSGSINAASAVFSGNVAFTGNVAFPTGATVDLTAISQSIVPSANLTYNLGSTTKWWNNIYGTAVHAQYADLAERFESDTEYAPGTVVEIGGSAEITAVGVDLSEDVFGVISTNAAYLMNSGAGSDITHPPVAVQGRVPVRVTGAIHKGDRLVSAGNGIARAGKRSEITAWNVIGRALENKTTPGPGVVEAVVKLNS